MFSKEATDLVWVRLEDVDVEMCQVILDLVLNQRDEHIALGNVVLRGRLKQVNVEWGTELNDSGRPTSALVWLGLNPLYKPFPTE